MPTVVVVGIGLRTPGARARAVVLDVLLALLIWALQLAELSRPIPPGSALRPADAWGVLLVSAAAVPLLVRRSRPRLALGAVLVAAALICVAGYRQSGFVLGLVITLYTMGSRVPTRQSVAPLAGSAALMVIAYLSSPEPVGVADVVQSTLSLVLAWWVGATLRVRSAYAWAMEERAELLHRLHDETTAAAVAQERLRIARELHDVLAHGMSVVAVQSGVARHLLDSRPEQVGAALDAIAGSSREAMTELRRLLGVLRQDGSTAAVTPSPTLADLPALIGGLGGTGLKTQLRMADPPPDVPAAIGLTAYRIVQEALTNVVRHAGAGARAVVSVDLDATTDADSGVLVIDVRDQRGRRAGSEARMGSGAGLIGIRERVGLFGGQLSTGPTGDGFAVHATLPVTARAQS